MSQDLHISNKPPKASVLRNLDAVRAMIRRHKRNDILFAAIGLMALMLGLLTLLTLFVDLVMDGYPRFNLKFFSDFPSRRAGEAGLPVSYTHLGKYRVHFIRGKTPHEHFCQVM